MDISAYGKSDVGRVREHNEDFFCIDADAGVHIVCDGMGGHAAGEVAAAAASEFIHQYIQERSELLRRFDGSERAANEVAELLNQAVVGASKAVYDIAAGDSGKHGMGTTCVVLLTVGDKGVMASVGDSRLYLARDGQLYQLSTDHNFMNEAIAQGMLSPELAAQSPHAHVLTRAVGTQPSVCPDMLIFDLLPGDTYLLCSDGLYEYTQDAQELCAMLLVQSLKDIPSHLLRVALEGGGHDNITAVVVRASSSLSDEDHQRERKQSVTRGLEALRDIELFRELSMPELVKVYNVLTTLKVDRETAIIREGDASAHLYVLVDGTVAVEREGTPLAILGAGTHFGEMALLNQRPRSATVIAKSRCSLLCLERSAFHELMSHEPSIATKFLWKFAQTLSLRLDDAYLARDQRTDRHTLGIGEYPSPFERRPSLRPPRR